MKWPFSRKEVPVENPQYDGSKQAAASDQIEPVSDELIPDSTLYMPDLKLRIREFLDGPVPPEISYAPGSTTETFMQYYPEGVNFDAEMEELLYICAAAAEDSERSKSTREAQAFFRQSGDIIKAIIWDLQSSSRR